ncbi:MAG: hypothetical protein DDT30_01574 [Dehalococcoidia bacterium]|nr:hypothetical protein [Bacillota bacterium]
MIIVLMVLGILGGLAGAFGALTEIGRIPGEFVIWGFLCSLMALAGGAIVLRSRAAAGVLMLIGGIGGLGAVVTFAIFVGLDSCPAGPGGNLIIFYVAAAFPLIIGGTTALAPCVKQLITARRAAMALGILGGLVYAFCTTYVAMGDPELTGEVLSAVLLLPVMAIAGGLLALTRPAAAGILMLISGIGGIVFPFLGWRLDDFGLVSPFVTLLLIPGGILALAAACEKHPPARIAAMVFGTLAGFVGTFGVASTGAMAGEILIWGLLCSLMAIIGGVLTLTRPTIARTLMLLSGIGSFGAAVLVIIFEAFVLWDDGFFVASYFIAGFLLILGGALAERGES